MTDNEILELLNEVETGLAGRDRLVSLQASRVVFVGDTHGDTGATERIIERYLKPENQLVFLGDYVDRGPASLQNINLLLQQKIKHPDILHLLMGNHEGYALKSFSPADFWEGLEAGLRDRYGEVLAALPLAASTVNGIIAVHAALPDVAGLEYMAGIEPGSAEWHQLTWGDWQDREGGDLGTDPFTGRPQFGRGWFEEMMSRLGKKVLIRSHQPDAPQLMYDKRCLTLFTSWSSTYYVGERTIALVDTGKESRDADDITIESI